MQQPAVTERGRSGLDRNTLEAIYVGLCFYRFKQRAAEAGDHPFSELGALIDGLRAMDTAELESATKHLAAEVAQHSAPDSAVAVALRLWALAAA